MRKAARVRGKRQAPALGQAIRDLREDRGLTQAQLAVAAKLAVNTLTRLEAGQSDPSWSSIEALARALDVKLSVLVRTAEAGEH